MVERGTRRAGFTLVELVVTAGIMVMILGAVTISGGQTNALRRLKTGGETLRQALYRTRGLALAPAVDKAVSTKAYCFSLTGPAGGPWTGFKLIEVSDPSLACAAQGPVVDEQSFPSDIVVTTSLPFDQDVVYAIDGYARITRPDPQTRNTIEITLAQARVATPLVVRLHTPTGQVELCQGTVCE